MNGAPWPSDPWGIARRIFMLSSLGVFAAGICSLVSAAWTDLPDQAEIRALHMQISEAWGAGDAARLALAYASDADFVDPSGHLSRGREEIEKRYASLLSSTTFLKSRKE